MKKSYIVSQDFIGARLDRWIRKNIYNIPQALIEKSLRNGKIKVNNKKKKSSYKLLQSDKIILNNFNFTPTKKIKNFVYKATKKEQSGFSEIFIESNENFAVINKPSGISVPSGTKSQRNLLDILKSTKEFEGISPYPVHRIDKETTGILVVAKNRNYAQLFTSLFRMRKIHKVYLCIAIGEFENKQGTFNDNLFYYEGNKKIEANAITNYKVINSNKGYSLVRLNPVTGRKHQLRKQLLIHGHPVLGDNRYRISFNDKKIKNNLMLHAYQINFTINNTKYKFIAKPPTLFSSTLSEKYLKNFL